MAHSIPPNQTIMPGLRFEHKAGKPITFWMDSIKVLQDALGAPLTQAFIRCFSTVDRLMSLLDVINMNNTTVPRDSVRGERNLHTLSMFAIGLVYELREGVQQLEKADILGHLSAAGRERWTRLQVLAKPKNERMLAEIRNVLAFHIGKDDVVARGIARLAGEHDEDDRPLYLTLISSDDDGKRVHARRDLGLAVLLAGMKVMPGERQDNTPNGKRWVTEKDLIDAFTEATNGHFAVSHLFDDLFLDVLTQAGAAFEPLGPFEEPTRVPTHLAETGNPSSGSEK